MSKLEELEEELYGENEGDLKKRMSRRIVFPGTLQKPPVSWLERKIKAGVEKGVGVGSRVPKLLVAVFAIFLIVGGALFIFLYLGTRGQEAEIEVQGREKIESGEILTIPIVFRNTSRSTLKEVELTIIIPEGSLVREGGREFPAPSRIIRKIKDLAPGEGDEEETVVRLFGREGEGKTVEVNLLYRPENLRARFSSRSSKTFTVSKVPLALSWELPEILSSGQEVEAKIRYTSSSPLTFEKVSLRLEYPQGFIYKSADPKPSLGDTIWDLGTVGPGSDGFVTFRGTISGGEGEVKTFQAGLGVFNILTKEWRPWSEASYEAKIAIAPLSVQGFLDSVRERLITPGERLNFTVRYKNNTASDLKNITIRAFLDGSILSRDTVVTSKGGTLLAAENAIIWGPGGTPELRVVEAGKEGGVDFHVDTREQPVVRNVGDKNLQVRLRLTIEAATTPKEFIGTSLASEDNLEFKVRSKVIFSGRALYRLSPLINSGPLPPKAGSKTFYTVVWEVRNFTNNMQNVEITTALPPNVKWENAFSPKDARIIFDEASSEVRWKIGSLRAGIGVLAPALVGAFQISVVPSSADVGKPLILTSKSLFLGTDTFTGENIEMTSGELTTELREDAATSAKDWSVVR
ncbi:MAG: hypothetical protein HYW89_02980 [Candidatus Sungiibacteriota bacterium]|uniref:DUF11 domain-containing protein n=1 Tax=Candidatus Sungiibacteriota bacterium TaxID=2750080 RepID=A0A7T5RIU6_9BACT|nr:MAG: hypothetical protein HYW89_02980 [Candidatus Sungbacteria bacterium]